MIFFMIAAYGLYSGSTWACIVGGAGSAFVLWDRQNYLARQEGKWGESGWIKSPKDKE